MQQLAFVFPGQGSQSVAMGRALAQTFPAMITYYELPGVTHGLLEHAAPLLAQAIEGRAE